MRTLVLLLFSVTLIVANCLAGPTNRVVGGEDAKEGQFPYQISLRRNNRHICGGSIITPNYILTAAHCVVNLLQDGSYELVPAEVFSVLAGTTNLLKGGIFKQVVNVQIHESYESIYNDLALVKLESPLTYTEKIQPIQLTETNLPTGVNVTISGWGLLATENPNVPVQLQWTTLRSISNLECLLSVFVSPNSLICLAHEENYGACMGDSGGPAVYNGQLVGVAGFVIDSCGSSAPDGYAKVSYHLDWIKQNTDL